MPTVAKEFEVLVIIFLKLIDLCGYEEMPFSKSAQITFVFL
jgi:hypothetical protein